jgi:hypothetical protein
LFDKQIEEESFMLIFDMARGTFIEPNAKRLSDQTKSNQQISWPTPQAGLQEVQFSPAAHQTSNPGVVTQGLAWINRYQNS